MTEGRPDQSGDVTGEGGGEQEIARYKVPYSAVVLSPPKDLWEPIQAIRREYDPQIDRWMPHVTLLYPFVQEEYLRAAAEELSDPCRRARPFELTLERFNHFHHETDVATLYLEPEPAEKVVELHGKLVEQMPWCDDTARFESGYVPHLSVGTCELDEVEQVKRRLQAEWSPLTWEVDRVCLVARPAEVDESFDIRFSLEFGVGIVE